MNAEASDTMPLAVAYPGPDPKAVPAVYEAIAKVSAELSVRGVGKDRTNQQQHFQYRGVDDVYQVLAAVLPKHGLVIIPRVVYRGQTERATKDGKGTLFYVVVEVEFDLIAVEDGSRHVARIVGEAMDTADKATNKAMAVAYKYMAFMVFCIPLEGVMLDPDATTHEVAAQPVAAKADAPKDDRLPAPAAAKRPAAKAAAEPPPPVKVPPRNPAIPSAANPPDVRMEGTVELTHEQGMQLDIYRELLAGAGSELDLRAKFTTAYTWASEIPDAVARAYIIQQVTMEKDTRKTLLAAQVQQP